MEGVDLHDSIGSDLRNLHRKLFLFARISILSDADTSRYIVSTNTVPYTGNVVNFNGADCLFPSVSRSQAVMVSLYLTKYASQGQRALCIGSLSIPISRLADNKTVTIWLVIFSS